MIQREKYLPCKPENLSSFSRTLVKVERKNEPTRYPVISYRSAVGSMHLHIIHTP